VSVGAHTLNVLSICTGGGGLDLGLELAIPSARPVCVLEREAFAVAHLVAAMQAGLMADCPVWTDARTFDGRPWRGVVDCLIGGIPCQPHSLAGRKLGQHDERDLWSDARRILVQARPWVVFIENVAGMLSAGADDTAGAERVLRDLRRLGFATEAGIFSAAEVGAPHQRERLFILGVADASISEWGEGRAGRGREAGGRAYDQSARSGPHVADAGSGGRRAQGHAGLASSGADRRGGELADAAHMQRHGGNPERGRQVSQSGDGGRPLFPPGPGDADAWRAVLARRPDLAPATQPGVCRMADGLAGRVDRLRMLGNGVVPLAAAHAVRSLGHVLAARSDAAARLVRMMEAAMPIAAE
jgi:DNA (cytosine-5)-methyltransferase 1